MIPTGNKYKIFLKINSIDLLLFGLVNGYVSYSTDNRNFSLRQLQTTEFLQPLTLSSDFMPTMPETSN